MMNKKGNALRLWSTLSEMPIDEGDCIENDFEHFPAGTFRQDIWAWLESEFEIRIYDLMFSEKG